MAMQSQMGIPVTRCDDVQPEQCLVVDVRTPAEFREVHIPGAVNIPLGDLGQSASGFNAKAAGRDIVLVCRTGKRAMAAFEQLFAEGVTNCRVLEGGLALGLKRGSR
jgi:rhodanese-related sulfurtransferase